MPFNFTDDVFLLHLAFETTQRAFERFAVAEFNFCHLRIHRLSLLAFMRTAVLTAWATVSFQAVKTSVQNKRYTRPSVKRGVRTAFKFKARRVKWRAQSPVVANCQSQISN
jgi:hypothetical protein